MLKLATRVKEDRKALNAVFMGVSRLKNRSGDKIYFSWTWKENKKKDIDTAVIQ